MKLLNTYKQILATAGLVVDKDGLVSGQIDDTVIPYTIKGKRLVLPTVEHLSKPDPETKVIFHPMSENVLRGESEVITRFRNTQNVHINFVVGSILEELMIIGTSVKMHSQLSPDQASILSVLKDADEKTFESLRALSTVVKKNISDVQTRDKSFVYLYLKRGAKLDGKNYGRACIVSFPLYEELLKNEKKVFDVSLRAKDKQMLIALFEFVFDKIGQKDAYSKGSSSDVAPFLDALMQSIKVLASNINTVVDQYDNIFTGKNYRYNDEWVEVFDNLEQLLPEIRNIPMQAGNEGSLDKSKTPDTPTPQLVTPSAAQPTQQLVYQNQIPQQQNNATYLQPITQQQPVSSVVITESGGIDFAATLRNQGRGTLNNTFSFQQQGWVRGQPVNNWQQPTQQSMPYSPWQNTITSSIWETTQIV